MRVLRVYDAISGHMWQSQVEIERYSRMYICIEINAIKSIHIYRSLAGSVQQLQTWDKKKQGKGESHV